MTQNLTTVARFNSWYNFPAGSADLPLIGSLIQSTSQDIMAYLARKTLLRTTFTEYYNGTGGASLLLRQWPVIEIATVNISGVPTYAAAPPSNGFFTPPWDGFPPGEPGYVYLTGGAFVQGVQNVNVTYDAGYAVEDEAGTIPSTGAPQITTSQTFGMWAQDDGVVSAAGTVYTKVTSAPAAGEYSVDQQGVYTFNSANAGTAVLISYSYVPNTLVNCCNMMVSEQYSYRQRIGQTSQSVQGVTTISFDNRIKTLAIDSKLQPFRRMVPF